jgi:hypothetical protein
MIIMLEAISSNSVILLTVIGILAFLVSAITEVTKNIGILAKVPTDLQVIVLSLILCLLTYFSYVSYINTAIVWYYVAGTIIGSFVAMYGWDKLTALWSRFQPTGGDKK